MREWFEQAFAAPTPAQERAWPAIAAGEHVLLSAPTGSGKTLAAFLWALDRLSADPPRGEGAAGRAGAEGAGAGGGSQQRAGGPRLARRPAACASSTSAR